MPQDEMPDGIPTAELWRIQIVYKDGETDEYLRSESRHPNEETFQADFTRAYDFAADLGDMKLLHGFDDRGNLINTLTANEFFRQKVGFC